MKLRDYQQNAIDSVWEYLRDNKDNPCVVIPTGGGKSPVLAGLCVDALTKFNRKARVLVLAHVKELVQQNSEKYLTFSGRKDYGIYSAGLDRRDVFNDVIFASIQSVHNKAKQMGVFDLILIDEAHRIPVSGDGMYRSFIDDMLKLNKNCRIVGLTATPYRLSGGYVCGEDKILNNICFDVGVKELIEEGYLSKLISKGGLVHANLDNVKIVNGDYAQNQLNEAMNKDEIIAQSVDEITRLCADRKSVIIFCVTVEHCNHVSAELSKKGFTSECLHSDMSSGDRDRVINEFKSGKFKYLLNINIASEGFDHPAIDCVVMMRPTKSAGLYYQQVGRGLRIDQGKENCLVLDFANNILEHGPIDSIKIKNSKKGSGKQKAELDKEPVKLCSKCQSYSNISATVCVECGNQFEIKEVKHNASASYAPILSEELKEDVDYKVDKVYYSIHSRPGKPESLKVSYQCGHKVFNEWVCLMHDGWAKSRAIKWWKERLPEVLPAFKYQNPVSIDDAIAYADYLKRPKKITVNFNDKFPRVVSYESLEEQNAEVLPWR